MIKRYLLWFVIAAVCLLVLIGTIWAVLGGVSSQMPQAPGVPPVAEESNDVQALPDHENYPMVDASGKVVGEDNTMTDPWANIADDGSENVSQDEVSEIPQDEIYDEEDLAVTDEGWSGIY